jgi:DNA polymerase-3 subunit epsilon
MGEINQTYTVFDVETPNTRNDSICSLSVLHVENGVPEACQYYLINPEADFSGTNMDIHHITPEMVQGKPTLNIVWDEIKAYFTNGIVVAHNARFDLSVLAKALTSYQIPVPDMYYICTMNMAKNLIPEAKEIKGGLRLNQLSDRLGIELKCHHNSCDDTKACHELLCALLSKFNGNFDNYVQRYTFDSLAYLSHQKGLHNTNSGEISAALLKSVNTFIGLIQGITIDMVVKDGELAGLQRWESENTKYLSVPPLSDILPKVSEILEDHIITKEEQQTLLELAKQYSHSSWYTDATISMQILNGIIAGIMCDNELNETEIINLRDWMAFNQQLSGNYPFDKIFELIQNVLEDGVIDESEHQQMMEMFTEFVNPYDTSCAEDSTALDVNGKVFCLSGDFVCGQKKDVAQKLVSLGAVESKTVTKKTTLLIVGGVGNENWKYGNYGTKVNKALEMQSKGHPIQILKEEFVLELLK